MRKSIEKKIADMAKSRVRVRITGRVRSAGGFDCAFPTGRTEVVPSSGGNHLQYEHDTINVPTKQEALSLLLIKAKVCDKLEFKITAVNKKPVPGERWCKGCGVMHVPPTTEAEHRAMGCRAKWGEEIND